MGRCFRIFFSDLAASACSGIHLSPGTTKFLIAAKLPIAPVGTGSFPVLGADPVCSGGSRAVCRQPDLPSAAQRSSLGSAGNKARAADF